MFYQIEKVEKMFAKKRGEMQIYRYPFSTKTLEEHG
jgi:hypothetical protein